MTQSGHLGRGGETRLYPGSRHKSLRTTLMEYDNRIGWQLNSEGVFMRLLLASAVVTAALMKGLVIGLTLCGAATTCAFSACRNARRQRREPEIKEQTSTD